MTSEGALVHHGRGDDTMILDGLNVQPAEIESRLLSHPAVAEAAAFSIKSVSRGDIPLAAVVLKATATEADLLKFCRGSLGPRSPLRVLAVAALPRNAAGKVLRGELARLVADRG
jgi:acyl-coenzyme A synthetase/AMP-(fatty) acid ligase